MKTRLFYGIQAVLSLLIIQGCDMKDSLVQEMDSSYGINQRDEDIVPIVSRYFPIGMKLEEALTSLESKDFVIVEYSFEKYKSWPKEEWERKYENDQQRVAAGIKKVTDLSYVAKKTFAKKGVFASKRAVIILNSDGRVVTQSKGFIYVDGI